MLVDERKKEGHYNTILISYYVIFSYIYGMGKVFEIMIKESISTLKALHKKEKNRKKKLRLLSLILTKEEKFFAYP